MGVDLAFTKFAMTDGPRYPEARVRLHSQHPLALMGAVREALRHAGAAAEDVERFSRGAASRAADEVVDWCREWARLDFYPREQRDDS